MTFQTQEEILAAQIEEHNVLLLEKPVVEDDDDEDDDEDEDEGLVDVTGRSKHSRTRSEKKCRKAMLKLGMKSIQGISRITIKRSKNTMIVISKPEVYESPISDTYVMIGKAKIENLSSQLQSQATEQFRAPNLEKAVSELFEDVDDADETGVNPNDIDLVMTQAGVSRSTAVKALKAADGYWTKHVCPLCGEALSWDQIGADKRVKPD